MNALAVISYAHVLLQEGFEAAVAQHYLWGFMLLVIIFYGPGALSVDGLLARRSRLRHARFLLTIAARISRYENNRTV